MVLIGLFDKLAIAALTTFTYGGLMPHARHGGIGVFSLDIDGSKCKGIGLEKEQIGQIQVALGGIRGAVELLALKLPEPAPPADGCPRSTLVVFCAREKCLIAFGYRVIFGDDFMKPAWFLISFCSA